MDGLYGFRSGLNQPVLHDLQIALYVGERRSKFVSDICGEVSAVTFSFFKLGSHGVKAVGQLANLAGAASVGAMRQVALAQTAGRRPQPLQGDQ